MAVMPRRHTPRAPSRRAGDDAHPYGRGSHMRRDGTPKTAYMSRGEALSVAEECVARERAPARCVCVHRLFGVALGQPARKRRLSGTEVSERQHEHDERQLGAARGNVPRMCLRLGCLLVRGARRPVRPQRRGLRCGVVAHRSRGRRGTGSVVGQPVRLAHRRRPAVRHRATVDDQRRSVVRRSRMGRERCRRRPPLRLPVADRRTRRPHRRGRRVADRCARSTPRRLDPHPEAGAHLRVRHRAAQRARGVPSPLGRPAGSSRPTRVPERRPRPASATMGRRSDPEDPTDLEDKVTPSPRTRMPSRTRPARSSSPEASNAGAASRRSALSAPASPGACRTSSLRRRTSPSSWPPSPATRLTPTASR